MGELKLTQEKLAERVGVTQGAVGLWLRDQREPSVEKMDEVLAALGVPMKMAPTLISAETPANYGLPTSFRYPVSDWQRLAEVEDATETTEHAEFSHYKAVGKAYWLRVEGDAMNAPVGLSIPVGMMVLIDAGVEAKLDSLVIARLPGNDQPVFRQLAHIDGQRMLKPLNPTYPLMFCGDDCELLGVAVEAIIRF